MLEPVISVRGLRKSYGELEAVRGIDLEVERGEVFAFLGPNGAGKTTTVEILEGYRKRTGGEVSVLGVDPASPTREWREQIGIVLQECRMHPLLTVRETLDMYAGYYRAPRSVEETIDLVSLTDKANARAAQLSGGQQRRLDVAVGLVGDGELLFLDEPTTGFDPTARRQAWGLIANLRELGKTVFLTTHYMDEAQNLADRVAIIAGGDVVAEGTPQTLAGRDAAPTEIRFRLPSEVGREELPQEITRALADGAGAVAPELVVLRTGDAVPLLNRLTGWAMDRGVQLIALEVTRPSLEDVYLEVTEEGRE
ncbi:MAG TPA: ABC transporter ATP-binding protein [Solirubrobacterales bacterium]|jgi:ABC-2 type transport system ATP-binding protein|nr:ABC transporter ATP-binding protein [Solirubrobacterales bacterium]